MEPRILEKLEWPILLKQLAAKTQTIEGRQICLNLKPDLSAGDVRTQWEEIEPIRRLIQSGYTPPIGELPQMNGIFRAASLGQFMDGPSLWDVLTLLTTVKHFQRFAGDFADKYPILMRYQKMIYSLPKLAQAIEKAISPDGQILDTASSELSKIRRQKKSIRQRIEKQITSLLTDNALEIYLQDKFFTIRADRYVIPIRLDGRGRVKGSIHDTSESGQTLFIEPEAIKPMNENLLELELSEKLEVLKIFRELSAAVSSETELLEANYRYLIELDVLSAKAAYAVDCEATTPIISSTPCLKLKRARHPLISSNAVANDIEMSPDQRILIVSGPNAGGKTVVLKTVGIIHLMAKAGLLIPIDSDSEIYLFDRLYIEMGDNQNITANLSTFSSHVLGLKPILENSTKDDLVLLDELATGTEPLTGSAIGQAVLEELLRRQVTGIVTTHFDSLKGLAVRETHFRNGSMEFSLENLKPTYKLVLDIPGQSYGIELAQQIGLPEKVIERATELKGRSATNLDRLIEDLQKKHFETKRQKEEYEALRIEMEASRHRWEIERELLSESKGRASKAIQNRYQSELEELRTEFNRTLEELKLNLRRIKKDPSILQQIEDNTKTIESFADEKWKDISVSLTNLNKDFNANQKIPGEVATRENVKIGTKVFVISLKHEATVTKADFETGDNIEVSAGLIKLKPPLQDLRVLSERHKDSSAGSKIRNKAISEGSNNKQDKRALVLGSSTNSIDLRGLDSEAALNRVWDFIDKAVMRGETDVLLIHGHGTDRLKKTIRSALAKESPYPLDFRAGHKEEGGDGVTIVHLNI